MTPESENSGLEGTTPIDEKQQVLLRCQNAGTPECPGVVTGDLPNLTIECLRAVCVRPYDAEPYRGVHNTAGNVDPNFRIATKQEDIE